MDADPARNGTVWIAEEVDREEPLLLTGRFCGYLDRDQRLTDTFEDLEAEDAIAWGRARAATVLIRNSTVLKGDVVDEVSKLKREIDGEIVVYASFHLLRTLMKHDLVDELRLMVYPVVLGAGERLFGETSDKKPMRILDAGTVAGDLAFLTYDPVRDA